MADDRPGDLIDQLLADHRVVLASFDELETDLTPQRQREVTDAAITELVQHSVVEEQLLYPLTARVLPDGRQLAEHEKQDHVEVERMMKELERLEAGSVEFLTQAQLWIASTRDHVAEEETLLFPRLREACEPADLERLGDQARALRRIAPTHPHPSTPNTPLSHATVGPVVGLVDRVRDALSGRQG